MRGFNFSPFTYLHLSPALRRRIHMRLYTSRTGDSPIQLSTLHLSSALRRRTSALRRRIHMRLYTLRTGDCRIQPFNSSTFPPLWGDAPLLWGDAFTCVSTHCGQEIARFNLSTFNPSTIPICLICLICVICVKFHYHHLWESVWNSIIIICVICHGEANQDQIERRKNLYKSI